MFLVCCTRFSMVFCLGVDWKKRARVWQFRLYICGLFFWIPAGQKCQNCDFKFSRKVWIQKFNIGWATEFPIHLSVFLDSSGLFFSGVFNSWSVSDNVYNFYHYLYKIPMFLSNSNILKTKPTSSLTSFTIFCMLLIFFENLPKMS